MNMDRETRSWFHYLDDYLEYLDKKIDAIQANLGNPVDNSKIDALKKSVDAKRVQLKGAVDANQ